jgi:hypothetical protein
MATTSPARIDDDLYASAKLAGQVQSRSASQQVAHWARIGREIEASASVSHKDIALVLAGSRSYDSLSVKEQAIIRAEWSARIDTLRGALNLADQFAATGRTWAELDDDGAVIERGQTVGGGGALGSGHVVEERRPRRVRTGTKVGSGRASTIAVKSSSATGVIAKSGKRAAVAKQGKTSVRRAGSHSSG